MTVRFLTAHEFVFLTGGRLGWAAISDAVGRRNLFYVFTLSSIPLYLSIPHFVDSAITNTAAFPVYAFIGSTVGAISIMGGTYAILPAYEADLFGAKNVGATHGVMMIYSATAALLGPSMLLQLRQYSERSAISDLMTKVRRTGSTMNSSQDYVLFKIGFSR